MHKNPLKKNTTLVRDALRDTQLWDLGGYLTVNLSETQRGFLQVQFPVSFLLA